MLLAIDIGNTNITLGLLYAENQRKRWRLRTIHDMTVDEYGVYLNALLEGVTSEGYIHDVIMSSVVPPLTSTFASVCREYLGVEPLIVTSDTPTGILVATDNPAEVGADRIVNAAAAYNLFPGNLIVVDMGTATTFDVISAKGHLLGVSIAPGLGLAASALSSRAAQLGHVALEAPPKVVGTNTTYAMQSGLVFGYISLIEGMVKRIVTEMEWNDLLVIGTGGLIEIIRPHTQVIDHYEPWLTLHGLQVIFEINQGELES